MTIDHPVQILIVDDHPLYLDGLVQLLQRHGSALRCHVANDAASAWDMLVRLGGDVDLVLADQALPGQETGLDLLERVRQGFPTIGRALFSGTSDAGLSAAAQRQGAMGFLDKAQRPEVWVNALQRMVAGETWFEARPAPGSAPLTHRQTAILQLIAQGQGNKQVARALGITERTVKYHLSQVFARLKVSSRAGAVAQASANGWIQPPRC